MAINRVDVQGTFIRQDVTQSKVEADNRAMADMTQLATQFEQEAEEAHITVSQTEASEAGEEKYDATEEGKNKDLLNGRRKKQEKKKQDELLPDPDGVIIGPDGRPVTISGARRASFDFKI